jgi:hypothetical protein
MLQSYCGRDARGSIVAQASHVGAVAFSRTANPATGDFCDAKVTGNAVACIDDQGSNGTTSFSCRAIFAVDRSYLALQGSRSGGSFTSRN